MFPDKDVFPTVTYFGLDSLNQNMSRSRKAKLDILEGCSEQQTIKKRFGCGKTWSHFENESVFVTHLFSLRTLKRESSHICRNSDYFDSCGNLFIFFWSLKYLLCVQELIVTLVTACACVRASVGKTQSDKTTQNCLNKIIVRFVTIWKCNGIYTITPK